MLLLFIMDKVNMFMNVVMIAIICIVLYSVYHNGLGLEAFALSNGKKSCCGKGTSCSCD